uniref:Uncharacterized protein n=1 Tax=Rhizophora mucronata TaxID=61149 RepID=A0A2P2Q7R6_RHIMU
MLNFYLPFPFLSIFFLLS